MQHHRNYDAEINGQIDNLALCFCDIEEVMKLGQKKKISFELIEIKAIHQCLME